MDTTMTGVAISPVRMESRRDLGIKSGDTVRVWQKIEEKGKTRLQAFEGVVLARKHGGEPGATFTVRRVSGGVGMERIYPLYSPIIDKIEIVKRAKVRRAKLYHIREKAAKEIKRQMRRMTLTHLATMSEMEEAARIEKEEKEKVLRQAQDKQPEEEAAQEDAPEENTETPEEEKQEAPEKSAEPKEESTEKK